MTKNRKYSGPVTLFQERRLPEKATPAGYAALIEAYGLKVPLPRTLAAIGERHRIRNEGGWHILTPRHSPSADLPGHLTFALKYEGVDLALMKRLFEVAGPGEIESLIRAEPTGKYARRIWFLYEWLTGKRLKLSDLTMSGYVPAIDPDQQWAIKGENSPRHRVVNNLPGTHSFCPLVFRTKQLDEFTAMNLAERARAVVSNVPRDLLARTAAFLLLKDSRSSYAIEGERAPQNRVQRWGRAIGEAGKHPIDLNELLRLQRIVIGDERFVRLGLRQEGGFVGEYDREIGTPIPDHISARPEDLPSLVGGLFEFDQAVDSGFDAVIAAAVLAFGFVYIHPFQDGNGRIHRYLIHHVLARHGFNPPGVVFPISATILDRIEEYRVVLEDYSRRLLPLIEWEATVEGNVLVHNETADFYRFFDATPQAEFLYDCVRKTIEKDLPRETDFLARYDQFRSKIEAIVDMPERTLDLLFRFLRQNGGRLSKRAREAEFAALKDTEVASAEQAYTDLFSENS
jgi:Fic family protein